MDDRFLHGLEQPPSPEFAAALRNRLRAQDRLTPRPAPARWQRPAAAAVAAAAATALFVLPGVRASAQAFLDLFRVVNFTAVPVDLSRLDRLGDAGLDLRELIGRQVEMVVDPGPPQPFATPQDAGRAAGIESREPAALPANLVRVGVQVQGERVARVTADGQRLRDVLSALGLADVTVPEGLDGQTATVRVPPVVRIEYANGDRTLAFFQARSPEITAPAGLDLPRLGEIALRIAGLDARQAHTLAQAIDWRSTFVVPVPAGSSAFRQVEVRGHRGLLVSSSPQQAASGVAWSEGGEVYGVTGNVGEANLLLAAESIR